MSSLLSPKKMSDIGLQLNSVTHMLEAETHLPLVCICHMLFAWLTDASRMAASTHGVLKTVSNQHMLSQKQQGVSLRLNDIKRSAWMTEYPSMTSWRKVQLRQILPKPPNPPPKLLLDAPPKPNPALRQQIAEYGQLTMRQPLCCCETEMLLLIIAFCIASAETCARARQYVPQKGKFYVSLELSEDLGLGSEHRKLWGSRQLFLLWIQFIQSSSFSRCPDSRINNTSLERTESHTGSVQQINLQDHQKIVKMLHPWAVSQCCLYSVITKLEMCSMFKCGSIAQMRYCDSDCQDGELPVLAAELDPKLNPPDDAPDEETEKLPKPPLEEAPNAGADPPEPEHANQSFTWQYPAFLPEVWTPVCMLISVSISNSTSNAQFC